MRKAYFFQKKNKKSLTCGFTFAETVLVISMISIIAIVIFNGFSDGLKIWERAYQLGGEEDILIFLEKFSNDVRNVVEYSKISPFEGQPNKLSFPTIIRVLADKKSPMKGEFIDQLGSVQYSFDRLHGQLIRQQANYSKAVRGVYDRERVLSSTVRAVRFQYLCKTPFGYEWKNHCEGFIPASIFVEVIFGEANDIKKITKMVNLPCGSLN